MKLFYFPVYGKAETIRMMLWKAGAAYENINLNPETLKEMKESGALEFGQVPMLELDDGTKLSQSNAIVMYLAQTHGFICEDAMKNYNAFNIQAMIFEDF